jgi:hypothetical protein
MPHIAVRHEDSGDKGPHIAVRHEDTRETGWIRTHMTTIAPRTWHAGGAWGLELSEFGVIKPKKDRTPGKYSCSTREGVIAELPRDQGQ